jgi:hypothetical protein
MDMAFLFEIFPSPVLTGGAGLNGNYSETTDVSPLSLSLLETEISVGQTLWLCTRGGQELLIHSSGEPAHRVVAGAVTLYQVDMKVVKAGEGKPEVDVLNPDALDLTCSLVQRGLYLELLSRTCYIAGCSNGKRHLLFTNDSQQPPCVAGDFPGQWECGGGGSKEKAEILDLTDDQQQYYLVRDGGRTKGNKKNNEVQRVPERDDDEGAPNQQGGESELPDSNKLLKLLLGQLLAIIQNEDHIGILANSLMTAFEAQPEFLTLFSTANNIAIEGSYSAQSWITTFGWIASQSGNESQLISSLLNLIPEGVLQTFAQAVNSAEVTIDLSVVTQDPSQEGVAFAEPTAELFIQHLMSLFPQQPDFISSFSQSQGISLPSEYGVETWNQIINWVAQHRQYRLIWQRGELETDL